MFLSGLWVLTGKPSLLEPSLPQPWALMCSEWWLIPPWKHWPPPLDSLCQSLKSWAPLIAPDKPHDCSVGNGWEKGYFPILYYLTDLEVEHGSLKTWHSLGFRVAQSGKCPLKPEHPLQPPSAPGEPWKTYTSLETTQEKMITMAGNSEAVCLLEVTSGRIVILPASGKLGNREGWPELQSKSVLR